MYSKTLITELMRARKYNLQKQVAAELGFSKNHISEINSGIKEFTEETATYIAEAAGLDTGEVLIKLAMAKAKSETTKSAWNRILKEHRNSAQALAVLGLMVLSNSFYYFA